MECGGTRSGGGDTAWKGGATSGGGCEDDQRLVDLEARSACASITFAKRLEACELCSVLLSVARNPMLAGAVRLGMRQTVRSSDAEFEVRALEIAASEG